MVEPVEKPKRINLSWRDFKQTVWRQVFTLNEKGISSYHLAVFMLLLNTIQCVSLNLFLPHNYLPNATFTKVLFRWLNYSRITTLQPYLGIFSPFVLCLTYQSVLLGASVLYFFFPSICRRQGKQFCDRYNSTLCHLFYLYEFALCIPCQGLIAFSNVPTIYIEGAPKIPMYYTGGSTAYVIFIVEFVCLQLIIALNTFITLSFRDSSQNYFARPRSPFAVVFPYVKLVYVLLAKFTMENGLAPWVINVYTIVVSMTLSLLSFKINFMYFNRKISNLMDVTAQMKQTAAIAMLIYHTTSVSHHTDAFIFVSLIVIAFFFKVHVNKRQMMFRNILWGSEIQNTNATTVQMLLNCISNSFLGAKPSMTDKMEFYNFFYMHQAKCHDHKCPCSMVETLKKEAALELGRDDVAIDEITGFISKFIVYRYEALFLKSCYQPEKIFAPFVSYISFLTFNGDQKGKAYLKAMRFRNKLSKNNSDIVILDCLVKEIEDEIAKDLDPKESDLFNARMADGVEFYVKKKQFQEKIDNLKTVYVHFYATLLEETIDLDQIYRLGRNYIELRNQIDTDFKALNRLNPQSLDILDTYIQYNKNVIDSTYSSYKDAVIKYKDLVNKRIRINEYGNKPMKPDCLIGNEDNGVVFISLEPKAAGKLLAVNGSFMKIFGYEPQDSKNFDNISAFIPSAIAKEHDNIIRSYVDRGRVEYGHNYFPSVLGLTKEGFLLPIDFIWKVEPLYSQLSAGAVIIPVKKLEHTINCTVDATITNTCKEFFDALEAEQIDCLQGLSMMYLCPKLVKYFYSVDSAELREPFEQGGYQKFYIIFNKRLNDPAYNKKIKTKTEQILYKIQKMESKEGDIKEAKQKIYQYAKKEFYGLHQGTRKKDIRIYRALINFRNVVIYKGKIRLLAVSISQLHAIHKEDKIEKILQTSSNIRKALRLKKRKSPNLLTYTDSISSQKASVERSSEKKGSIFKSDPREEGTYARATGPVIRLEEIEKTVKEVLTEGEDPRILQFSVAQEKSAFLTEKWGAPGEDSHIIAKSLENELTKVENLKKSETNFDKEGIMRHQADQTEEFDIPTLTTDRKLLQSARNDYTENPLLNSILPRESSSQSIDYTGQLTLRITQQKMKNISTVISEGSVQASSSRENGKVSLQLPRKAEDSMKNSSMEDKLEKDASFGTNKGALYSRESIESGNDGIHLSSASEVTGSDNFSNQTNFAYQKRRKSQLGSNAVSGQTSNLSKIYRDVIRSKSFSSLLTGVSYIGIVILCLLLATTLIFYTYARKQISEVSAIASSFVNPMVMNENFAASMVELEKHLMITSGLVSYANTSAASFALSLSRLTYYSYQEIYRLAYQDFLTRGLEKISYDPRYKALSTEILFENETSIPVPVISFLGATLDKMRRYDAKAIAPLYSNDSDVVWLRLNANTAISTLSELDEIKVAAATEEADESYKFLVVIAVLAFVSNICFVCVFFGVNLLIERRRVQILSLFCKISAKSAIEEILKFLKNNDEYTKARIQKTIDLKRVRDRIFSKYKTSTRMSGIKAFVKFTLFALGLSSYFIWEMVYHSEFTEGVNAYIQDMNLIGDTYTQTTILYFKAYRMYNLINETAENRSNYHTNELEVDYRKEMKYFEKMRGFLLEFGKLEHQFLYRKKLRNFIEQIKGSQWCDLLSDDDITLYNFTSFDNTATVGNSSKEFQETYIAQCLKAFGGISNNGFLLSLQKVLNVIQDTALALKDLDQNDVESVQTITSKQEFRDLGEFSAYLAFLIFYLLNLMVVNLDQVVNEALILQVTVEIIAASVISIFTIVAWFMYLAKTNKQLFEVKEILNILPTNIMIGNVYIYNFLNKEAKLIS